MRIVLDIEAAEVTITAKQASLSALATVGTQVALTQAPALKPPDEVLAQAAALGAQDGGPAPSGSHDLSAVTGHTLPVVNEATQAMSLNAQDAGAAPAAPSTPSVPSGPLAMIGPAASMSMSTGLDAGAAPAIVELGTAALDKTGGGV